MNKRNRRERPERARKPTKHEMLASAVAADNAHLHSTTINSRIRVLQFEAAEQEKSIVALGAAIANAKERRAEIAAALAGLSAVLAKRC